MTDQQNPSAPLQISGANFPYRQFILGALVPISLFYAFHRFGQPLAGALLAIGWSLSLFDCSNSLRYPRDGADACLKLSVPGMVLGASNGEIKARS